MRRRAALVYRRSAHRRAGLGGWTVPQLQPTGRSHSLTSYCTTLMKRLLTRLKFHDLMIFYTYSSAIKLMKRFLKTWISNSCTDALTKKKKKYHHGSRQVSVKIPFASFCKHNKLTLLYVYFQILLISILFSFQMGNFTKWKLWKNDVSKILQVRFSLGVIFTVVHLYI